MIRWLFGTKEIARLGGRTDWEWYRLHECPAWRKGDWSSSLKLAVQEIAAKLGKQAARIRMTDVLAAGDSEVARCVAAIQLCLDRPPDALDALIAALNDQSEIVRRTAAVSLVEIGSVRGLAAVVAGSKHGHGIRTVAAHRLRELKSDATDAIPALMVLLQCTDINWRSHAAAADALAAIGDAAIPSLVCVLHQDNPYLRLYAAQALDAIGKTPELQPLIDEELRKAEHS